MRNFNFALFLGAIAACILVVPVRAQAPSAPSSKKVLDDMIQKLGGQAFMDISDIHTSGNFFQFKRGELTGGDYFIDYIRFPMMERTEFGKTKNKEITINNGDLGWKITPKDKEPKEQAPAEIQEFKASFKTSFDYILRFTLFEPKTTIQIIGSEIVDFNRTDVLEIRDPEKNRIVLYVDRTTKLPVKMQVRRVDEKVTHEERYGNWHAFQGIMTPLFVGRYTDNDKTMEVRVDSASFNTSLPDNLFTVNKK
jgi:hypothetical protein